MAANIPGVSPGPWKFSRESDYSGIYEISSGSDACWIAKVQNHRNCIATPEGEGNARLIAAAPQLYAACAAFVEAWEKSLQLEKTDVALNMARAALAAVQGGR